MSLPKGQEAEASKPSRGVGRSAGSRLLRFLPDPFDGKGESEGAGRRSGSMRHSGLDRVPRAAEPTVKRHVGKQTM